MAGAEYNPKEIEPKWQRHWREHQTFRALTGDPRPKYYVLDMFPYPSGSGLHVGHPLGYIASDVIARTRRAQGHNVLHPMGWDAFGLPAEQHAIQTGTHPAQKTAENIATFRRQLSALGFSYDWDREVNTTDPAYYKWTQWIFLQLFKRGLAYVDHRPVWWCPALGTVLANEEVIDGKSERGQHPVERRALRQWVLRITAYADRLLAGLDGLDWPDSTKRLQANWIGRSEGAEVDFALEGRTDRLTVYTTRPDTLFGATYMVLSPEHPLVAEITTPEQRASVEAYRAQAARKSDLDRTDLAKDKTGVFTGAFAINPVNQRRIPVWVADYVLMSYGTGAIMAVPAHDERDYEFAVKFALPIQPVVEPAPDRRNGQPPPLPFCEPGVAVHSDAYTGMPTAEAKRRVTADLEVAGRGRKAVNFKLRDWLFARQRYWGEPFPIVWVDEEAYAAATAEPKSPVGDLLPPAPVTCTIEGRLRFALPLPASQLPLRLPEVESYLPSGTGESPLAQVPAWTQVWLNVRTGEARSRAEACPEGPGWVAGERETNTMPQWAGSCWYYLRYCDPHNDQAPIGREAEQYWGVPDFYIGGAEHAVLHLLYARFWHMVLFDEGVVTSPEPFRKLFHQGLILGEDGEKMSKSRGNVVNPDPIIESHGTDALRLYEMFMGPLEDAKPWNTASIEGISRFLKRVWREIAGEDGGLNPKVVADGPENAEVERALHATIKKVTEDIERLRFNTAVSAMMVFSNVMADAPSFTKATARTFIQLLAPFAPHLAEELWQRLGGTASIAGAPWPTHDPAKLVASTVKVPVQVNGKMRGEIFVAPDAPQESAVATALQVENVARFVEGKPVRKVVYVAGKILNLVVG